MAPVPLVVAAVAALAGAALLAVPAVRPAPGPVRSPGRSSGSVVRPGVDVAAGPAVTSRAAAAATRFWWPLSPTPQVLRRFAVGPEPWSPGHRGVDLGASTGQPVLAAGAGTVAFAGVVAGRGVVSVAHPGGLKTTYEPVTAQVRAGQAVAAGEALGALATGSHCPTACLHWGALRGAVYLDPLSLLRPPAPPILLPLAGGRSP